MTREYKKKPGYMSGTIRRRPKELPARREKMAQIIASGNSATEAYRQCYCTKTMSNSTMWNSAWKVMQDPRMIARVAELKKGLGDMQMWSRIRSMRLLAKIAMAGVDEDLGGSAPSADGQEVRTADRVNAIKELNAMCGYNAPISVDVQMLGDDGLPVNPASVGLVDLYRRLDDAKKGKITDESNIIDGEIIAEESDG